MSNTTAKVMNKGLIRHRNNYPVTIDYESKYLIYLKKVDSYEKDALFGL
jgi:hypothetical protein